ncbi:uncharacterized protein LOC143943407 [Lithobates pipiens]
MHGLYVKAEKHDFEKKMSIQFLGLIITTDGIAMDPQKGKAILEWPAPSDKKGIQSFANFYRKFVKNFSAIISPINQITHQHAKFQWSVAAQTFFTSAPVLQHPDPALPYVLEVNAL